jgi:hypothetical protein
MGCAPYKGRFCCSHPYKAGIAWQRRPKTRKRHLMVVLDGVKRSLLGVKQPRAVINDKGRREP